MAPQSEQMDAESADMLAALRRQIQPHLMMAALTPPRLPGAHPPPPAAQLNYSLPLPSYMMHVSVHGCSTAADLPAASASVLIAAFVAACKSRGTRTMSFIRGGRGDRGGRRGECLGRAAEPGRDVVVRRDTLKHFWPASGPPLR